MALWVEIRTSHFNPMKQAAFERGKQEDFLTRIKFLNNHYNYNLMDGSRVCECGLGCVVQDRSLNWFTTVLGWVMGSPTLGVSGMACGLGGMKGKGRLAGACYSLPWVASPLQCSSARAACLGVR